LKERKKHKYKPPRTNAFTDPERFSRLVRIRRADGEYEFVPFGLLTKEQSRQAANTVVDKLTHRKREKEEEEKERNKKLSVAASKFLTLRRPD